MDIYTILKDLYRTRNLQQWMNNRFRSDTEFIIKQYSHVVEVGGIKFWLDDMYHTIDSANKEYNYNDLRKTDIVLDIGACIGAFSLKVAPYVKTVYAVEPVMTEALMRNKELNNADNITVIRGALGNGERLNLNWMGHKQAADSYSLAELIQLCGGHVDWIKCDCEGGEWLIKPEELKNVRRFEAEIHDFSGRGYDKINEFYPILKQACFEYSITDLKNYIAVIIHARSQ